MNNQNIDSKGHTDYKLPAKQMIIALCAIGLCSLWSCKKSQKVEPAPSIEGVWEYVRDDLLYKVRGMSFFTRDHFAFVVTYKNDSSDNQQQVLAHSGTYVLQDSLVTATIKYSVNPSLEGQKLRWIHKSEGKTATYDVLNKDGEIVESGQVIKIE